MRLPFSLRRITLLLSIFLLAVPFGTLLAREAEPPPPSASGKPRLLVIVVFDQFRADYLDSFSNTYGAGGFKRVIREGSNFLGSAVLQAGTFTAPGHATISTGTWAKTHGIIGNSWADRTQGRIVYSVEEPGDASGMGASPSLLRAATLAEMVQQNGGGKVIALSMKDRSAILLGGKNPTAAIWFRRETAELAARAAGGKVPGWIADWNGTWRKYSRWADKKWEALPVASTASDVEPNDFPMDLPPGFGSTFPHHVADYDKNNPKPFWDTFEGTPFAGDLLEEIAELAIKEEELGKDDKIDLLAISFSQTDLIGHTFGPDSAEVRDSCLRSDQQLEKLLSYLDKVVGKENYSIVVTSDHGVATVPEISKKRGGDAGRVSLHELAVRFEKYFSEALDAEGLPASRLLRSKDKGERIGIHGIDLTLDPATLSPDSAARVRDVAARVMRGLPEVRYAYTREELSDKTIRPFIRGMRLSFDPERSGDLMFIWRLNWISDPTGTTHGSPDPPDAYVPLLFAGNGIRAGAFRTGNSTVADIVPTLLSVAGMPIPKGLSGRVLPVSSKPAPPVPSRPEKAAPPEPGNDAAEGDPSPPAESSTVSAPPSR